MGSSETEKTAKDKEEKPPATTGQQEQSSTTNTGTVNPDWTGFQAYSPIPPHGFVASSPQAHPYMWGVQPMMPPYGTPPHPYVAMYPHGGIYAHPSMPPGSYPFSPFPMPSPNGVAEASGYTPVSSEADGKPSDVKEKLPIKRSKGSLGSLNMITGKNNELGKTTGASANGVHPKSGESGSEGTSEGSDENSQSDSQLKSGGEQDCLKADASHNGGSQNGGQGMPNAIMNHAMAMAPVPATGAPAALPGPATNLNIGMDYWGAPTSSAIPGIRGKSPTPVAGATRDPHQSQHWLQDERELKRQKRKQSNRESARRSRLRKQAECDELAQRAEALKEENANLRSEVNRIKSEFEQLLAENESLKERLGNEENEKEKSGEKDAV